MDAESVQRAAIDHEAPERMVSLRRALGLTSFGLNQMTFQPGQRWRIHRHTRQEEVYLVLRGTITLVVEAERELELGEGELARVAPTVRRQLVNRSAGPVTLLAMGGSGEHESRDAEAFVDWSDQVGRSPREVPIPEDLPLDGS